MPVHSDLHFGEATKAVVSGVSDGLEAAAKKEKENVEKNYDRNKDALGEDWEPLAPATIRKKGHSSILYETGDMRSAFFVRKTGKKSVAFGNSDPKINIHEDGTETIPARPVLSPAKVHLKKEVVDDEIGEAIRKQIAALKFGRMF